MSKEKSSEDDVAIGENTYDRRFIVREDICVVTLITGLPGVGLTLQGTTQLEEFLQAGIRAMKKMCDQKKKTQKECQKALNKGNGRVAKTPAKKR